MSANSKESGMHWKLDRVLSLLERLTGICLTTQQQIQQIPSQGYTFSELGAHNLDDIGVIKVEPETNSREARMLEALRGMRHKMDFRMTDTQIENEIVRRITAVLDEPENENLPCPFCGGKVDVTGWMNNLGIQGPECEDCGATASDMDTWNKRV